MSRASTLIAQLTAALVPHVGSTDTASPKAVAKTLKKLAEHLTKQQRAAHKAAHSSKHARKVLAGELISSLQGFLTPVDDEVAESPESPKSVAKTIKRLAAQLDNDRRKQAKRATKAARTVAPLTPAQCRTGSYQAPHRKATLAKTTAAKAVSARAE